MPRSSPPPRPRREGESLRDKLFYIGVAAVFTALGVGAAYVSPVLFYDCARQANGSVDCTVHRRMYGFIPLSDLHFSRILSVEVKSGAHSETIIEREKAASARIALATERRGCLHGRNRVGGWSYRNPLLFGKLHIVGAPVPTLRQRGARRERSV